LTKINHSLHDAEHHPENMKMLFSEQSTQYRDAVMLEADFERSFRLKT
jgi:hypothetical protein